jgi:hypothetical protein
MEKLCDRRTYRPDFRVNVPNLRAFTFIECSMSSVWYDSSEDDILERRLM